jgi:hypothetical protein
MFIAELNWIAILVGFVVFFAVGAIWFGPKTFYPTWVRLMGITEQPGQGLGRHGMAFVFGLTALGALVQVVALASVIHFVELANGSPVGPLGGLLTGLLVGIGFTAAGSLSHRLFSGQGVRVWAIEVGGDLVAMTLAGLVIGLFG